MGMTDPIADFLTRIRNANRVKHKSFEVPASKLKLEIARILRDEGFIAGFAPVHDGRHSGIQVQLKYSASGERVIHGLQRLSKPGCRRYVSVHEIPKVLGGLGVSLLSTSRGVLTGEQAKRAQVGGELLCEVW
jgi:small subunit ribosomal protein S8